MPTENDPIRRSERVVEPSIHPDRIFRQIAIFLPKPVVAQTLIYIRKNKRMRLRSRRWHCAVIGNAISGWYCDAQDYL